jgi:hypothetical protein
MSTLSGDDSVAPFDQTNGMMPGADGESDGTAESDTASAADRGGDDDGATDTADGAGALGTGIAMRHGPAGT